MGSRDPDRDAALSAVTGALWLRTLIGIDPENRPIVAADIRTTRKRPAIAATEPHIEGPVDRWRRVRAEIHEEICRRAFNTHPGSFTQASDSDLLDASTLLIPQVGFMPLYHSSVLGTVGAAERKLLRTGFVLRYDTAESNDGLPAGEGALLPCSFWLAGAYALMARPADAHRLFERLVGLCITVNSAIAATTAARSAAIANPSAKAALPEFPDARSQHEMAALGEESIELLLLLSATEALQELPELALLLFLTRISRWASFALP